MPLPIDDTTAQRLRDRFANLRNRHPLPPPTDETADKTFVDDLSGDETREGRIVFFLGTKRSKKTWSILIEQKFLLLFFKKEVLSSL